jgi:hypothetical protein
MEAEETFYLSTRADTGVDAYAVHIEEPSWWVEKLDSLAAWLEDNLN